MSAAANPKTMWSHCNECGRDTKHAIVHKAAKRRTFDDDGYSVEVGSDWTFVQCCGCEEVSMRRIDWCSEDDRQDGPNPPTFFPPRVSRRQPDWVSREPRASDYQHLLEEVYTALHADSRRLAMMGARALIDMVITNTVGDQGNFSKGLDELEKQEFISKRDRAIIGAAIDAGSAAMHRGHQPKVDDLNVVIDIVERMIHAEILDAKAKELAASTPKRERATAKKK